MDRSVEAATLVGLLGDWTSRPGRLYQRLAAAVRQVVQDGGLGRGDRLPAERTLAAALSVSRATVVAAYDALRSTGDLVSRPGSGTRVSDRPPATRTADGRVPDGRATAVFQRLVNRPDEPISLALATAPAVPELRAVLLEVVEHDLPALLADSGYHPLGLPALRVAVADHLTGLGLPSTPDQVLVTTGAHQALELAAQLYLARRATVLVESPSWPGCLDVFRGHGAVVAGVPIDQDGVRPDHLANALRAHRPSLIYVMPTYHNPTGALMSAHRRVRLAELAARHDVPVLEDNAYATDVPATAPPPVGAFAVAPGEVLTVGSLAKTVWAGLRIGWVRADRTVIDRLARRKVLADLGSPVLDQAVAARLLPMLGTITASRAPAVAERRTRLETWLYKRLPTWRWRTPAGGTALWIALPDADAAVFAQLALRHGVEVVPGSATDPSGEHDNHIRLPFTFPPATIDTVVTRLERAWADFRGDGK